MQTALDESVFQREEVRVTYGGFWARFGALFLDGLILAPLSFGVSFFNIISWKSAAVMMLINLVGIGYKPFMEFYYGATLGKMALRLKVVNLDFEQPDLQTVLLRNIFHIVPSLVLALLSISMYNDPDFVDVSSYTEYAAFGQKFVASQFISICSAVLTFVEAIMIGVDDQKRSLHDRIAGTYVIERP